MAHDETLDIDGSPVAVEFLGRCGARYTEDGRTMSIDGAMLTGSADFLIFVGTIVQWEDGQRVSVDKRNRIVSNIARYATSRGWVVEFRAPLLPDA